MKEYYIGQAENSFSSNVNKAEDKHTIEITQSKPSVTGDHFLLEVDIPVSPVDHVQITFYMKCSINIDKEIGLEEKGWHWIKSYKWTENSKLKLIDALLTENVKNEIIEFEMVNYEENQVGVDEATEKLTKILDNISSLSCQATPKTKRRKKKKKFKQVWSDNVIYETKRQINKIGNKIRNNPNNNSLKQTFFELKKKHEENGYTEKV
ncbi:unnamed protein product [Mytilus coruscus]|uniref:Uncharacterized protein n=1 Tax=Mytilus coruscus TaxID=42192 RepID=A0A6J8A4Q0_MYTCO|nr:unnamed protein product [Mytilus coruscus]